jgi:4'-phosphopantetheinyl transferase
MERDEVTLQSSAVPAMSMPSGGMLPTLDPVTILSSREPLAVSPATVHVWCFALSGTVATVELCRGLLSQEECHRADRFVFERDRVRYTVAHAVMRNLLGRYCDLTPQSLRFSVTAAGKPSLAGQGTTTPPLHFNLTHSDDRGLLGLSVSSEIGVDIEKVRTNIEALAISRHYFFGSEREAIEATAEAQRHDMFFRYWVAKEAVLKAQGIGLGFPLDRFRVDFLADGTAARIDSFDASALRNDWRVRLLPCERGWHAAVAACGEDWRVQVEPPGRTRPIVANLPPL